MIRQPRLIAGVLMLMMLLGLALWPVNVAQAGAGLPDRTPPPVNNDGRDRDDHGDKG